MRSHDAFHHAALLTAATNFNLVRSLCNHDSRRMTTSCVKTVCVEHTKSCGVEYSGCYASYSSMSTPTYQDPGCPLLIAFDNQEATAAVDMTVLGSDGSSTKCVDLMTCWLRYGGCFAACPPFTTPQFVFPDCPTISVITPTAMVTATMHCLAVYVAREVTGICCEAVQRSEVEEHDKARAFRGRMVFTVAFIRSHKQRSA
jgi:hypothetical protein